MLIWLVYRWRTDADFKSKMIHGYVTRNFSFFTDDDFFWNKKTNNISDRIMHTSALFWLTILIIIILLTRG
jgi:hypothetical protein